MKHHDEQINFIINELIKMVNNPDFLKNIKILTISKKVLNKYYKKLKYAMEYKNSIKLHKYYNEVNNMEDKLFQHFLNTTLKSFKLILATNCILPNNERQMLYSLYTKILNENYYLLEELNYERKFDKTTIKLSLKDVLTDWSFIYLYSYKFFIYNFFNDLYNVNDNEDLKENFNAFAIKSSATLRLRVCNECSQIFRDYGRNYSEKIVQNELKLLFCRIKV